MSTEYETVEMTGPETYADYAEVEDGGEVIRIALVAVRGGNRVVVQRIAMGRGGFLRSLLAAVALLLPGLRNAAHAAARFMGH